MFADCLKDTGFSMGKLEPDICIRKIGDIYRYISVYVNDLVIAARDPKSLMDALEKYISSILRERYQFHFNLGVIYSLTVIVLDIL